MFQEKLPWDTVILYAWFIYDEQKQKQLFKPDVRADLETRGKKKEPT